MTRNRIRQDLETEGFTIGSWLNLASGIAAEVMAGIGFSWLGIDAEHAPLGLSDIANLIRAIESRGAVAVVRVPDHDFDTIGRVLDAGALGIVAPHVRTAEQAQRIASACRFRPRGTRSVGTTRAATHGASYLDEFNEQVVVMAQIEEAEGVANAEQIVKTDGIDVGFLGPNDLSWDLGVPRESPALEQAIEQVLAACRRAGKPAGIPSPNADALIRRRTQGFSVLTLASDFRLLESIATEQLRAARLPASSS
jgi:2-keto-3-deoxy-L-rhamnonate aldolase RhmA